MTQSFRLTMTQLNPVMGDLSGNANRVRQVWAEAKEASSDYVVCPEMFLLGYNPQDLVMKPALQNACMEHLEALAADCADGPAIGIGAPVMVGPNLHNGYFVLSGGKISAQLLKHHLPNYNVFDEQRTFKSGEMNGPYVLNGVRIGTPICEDAWHEDVAETLAETGAEFLVVPNGSPYRREKYDTRLTHMVSRVIENDMPLVYVNMVGGQDDQAFDGGSFVLNRGGKLAALLPVFEEAVAHITLNRTDDGWDAEQTKLAAHPDAWEQDYHAMVVTLRDYLGKSGFKKVLLGLSGGIDSALVAMVAVDAIGADNVRCIMLPSEYTSEHSLEDAKEIAENLGVKYHTVPITPARDAFTETLAPMFEGLAEDVTEENIQSRIRGTILMALSNKFGEMLLTTGNKSEMATGYCTIYGDMNGGYNPIKDMYKSRVFETCRWRNAHHRPWMKGPEGEVCPPRIITKPPSAELRPDQKDEDSLPPYDVLDAILTGLVDHEESVDDLVSRGYDRDDVKRVEHLLYINEWKRYQAAPGTRLTTKAFWMDRRYPIVNRFRTGK
ncbi:NAD+ synthase [Donghicola eburneus]|uniref:Glutamine-dependent NAD(+) synthetase n=1 Tax=Donghicola eburneus TaxID=393278 RepID=A0A1M4N633_9RHOB|nr:NAD+ synthase [Donghicola eburneus]SCM69517.1 Glutamine-dependent NAD(+) synthetase [Donghicola eburneus]SFQ47651.1 NAD+ synthase [Donghicola eburneus]